MPATIVPRAEVVMDAAVFPWTPRPKYARVQELLDDYAASNAQIGRQRCPVSDYFRAHLDDDILDVEAHVYAHPEWGPFALCESLHQTLLFNNAAAGPDGEFVAAWAQHYLALNLVRYHPYERARAALEPALKHPRLRFASGAAQYVLLAYVNAGHPNPRRLLEKPEIRAKFPASLDVAAFPAPDFA
jgi:hypothetical protein